MFWGRLQKPTCKYISLYLNIELSSYKKIDPERKKKKSMHCAADERLKKQYMKKENKGRRKKRKRRKRVLLPGFLYPMADGPDFESLHSASEPSHGGVSDIRDSVDGDLRRINKLAAWLSPLRNCTMIVKVHYTAFGFMGRLTCNVLRHVDTCRKHVTWLYCIFPVPSYAPLCVLINQLLEAPFPVFLYPII